MRCLVALVLVAACFSSGAGERRDAGVRDATVDATTPRTTPRIRLRAHTEEGIVLRLQYDEDVRFWGYFDGPLTIGDDVVVPDRDLEIIAVDLSSDLRWQVRTSHDGDEEWPFANPEFIASLDLIYGDEGTFTLRGFTPEQAFVPDLAPLREGFLGRFDRSGRAEQITDELSPAIAGATSANRTVTAYAIDPERPLRIGERLVTTRAEMALVMVGLGTDGEPWTRLCYEGPNNPDLDLFLSMDGAGSLTAMMSRLSEELTAEVFGEELTGVDAVLSRVGADGTFGPIEPFERRRSVRTAGEVLLLQQGETCVVTGFRDGRMSGTQELPGICHAEGAPGGAHVAAVQDGVTTVARVDGNGTLQWSREVPGVRALPTRNGVWVIQEFGPADAPFQLGDVRRETADGALAFVFVNASGEVARVEFLDEIGNDTLDLIAPMVAYEDSVFAFGYSEVRGQSALTVITAGPSGTKRARFAGPGPELGCADTFSFCGLAPHAGGVDAWLSWRGSLTLPEGRELFGAAGEFLDRRGGALVQISFE
ncbi:MAG: hypothetical protein AAGE52_34420 [Myxococcota bacterium]